MLLSVLQKARFAPELTGILLRPGTILARKTRANGVLAVLSDSIIFGLAPFLAIRSRYWQRGWRGREPRVDKRRSLRLALALPIFIYANLRKNPFFENTETINISATGGLVPISVKMTSPQELILTNTQTDEDSLCRVVRSAKSKDGKPAIGIEFVRAPANFWSVIVSSSVSTPSY